MVKHYEEVFNTSISDETIKKEAKAKRKGKGEPFIEQLDKSDICHDTGRPTKQTRTIDREGNKYAKTVKDSETGEVIYTCDEDLDKHIGHGTAKTKKPKNAEKPISLKPYEFDDAVEDLLKVKPEAKKSQKGKEQG